MQHILAPTDFSSQARNACIFAAELAKRFNARLTLFHAYMLPTPVTEVPYVMVTVDQVQKDNELLIKKEADHLNSTFGIETDTIVRIGIPSDEIRTVAEDNNADLVVMGMKGAGGIEKLVGSTTVNAIRKVAAPVLVVPDVAAFRGLDQIVLALDNEPLHSSAVLSPLQQIKETFASGIHIVNVSKQAENTTAGTKTPSGIMASLQPEIHHIVNSSVVAGILDFVHSKSANMLAVVSHRHSFLDRLFARDHTALIARATDVPLMVLHDREDR
jgi:nucleotide-binding universal stress UspA family protein